MILEELNRNLTSNFSVIKENKTIVDNVHFKNTVECCICKMYVNKIRMISLYKSLQDNIFAEAIGKMYPEFVSIIINNISSFPGCFKFTNNLSFLVYSVQLKCFLIC